MILFFLILLFSSDFSFFCGVIHAEHSNVGEMHSRKVILEAIAAPIVTLNGGAIAIQPPGITSSSSSEKEGGLEPVPSGGRDRSEDKEVLLKKTTDPRLRKVPVSSHQLQTATAPSALNSSAISVPSLAIRNAESRPAQVITRQLQQRIRKVPLNSSPLGRSDLSLLSRTNQSHMRSEVLMRSPSHRGVSAITSVIVPDRAVTVSLTGPASPEREHHRNVKPVTASIPLSVSTGLPAACAQSRLQVVSGENLSSARLGIDVAPMVKSTTLLDCQFLQFESDGDEDW